MKKFVSVALALFISQSAIANVIKDGKYKGEGVWKTRSESATYLVETEISGNKVSSHYTFPNGSPVKDFDFNQWDYSIKPTNNDLFDVFLRDEDYYPSGAGYCLEKSKLCHYSVFSLFDLHIEETSALQDETLHKYGSITGTGMDPIVWEENLKPV